jgi:hypothetical protein
VEKLRPARPSRGREFPTMREIANLIGMDLVDWPGRCHEVALKIVHSETIEGEARYGLYHGPIHKDSRFAGRQFTRHGWIEVPDGRIVDPTRWVFESCLPYLYVCPGDNAEYDFGGNNTHEATMGPCPKLDPSGPVFTMELLALPAMKVAGLTGEEMEVAHPRCKVVLGNDQLFWLANYPLRKLVPHATDVYREIIRLGHVGYIPIDNRRLILGE